METNFLAQLYTGRGKYSVHVTLSDIFGRISYFDPEQSETVIIGRDARLALAKHGWFFSDFWVTDPKNSPLLWRHKLTFYKSDGVKVGQALAAWSRCS